MAHWFTDLCETCGRRFVNANVAEQHMGALGHLSCSACDRYFQRNADLTQHTNFSIHRNLAAPVPNIQPPSTPAPVLAPQITTYHTPSAPVLTPHVTANPNPPASSRSSLLPALPLVTPEAAANPPTFVAPAPARPLQITRPPLPAPVTLYIPPVPPNISTGTITGFQRSDVTPPPVFTSAILPTPPVQPKLLIATAPNFHLGDITPPPTPAPALTFESSDLPSWPVARLVGARPVGPAPIPLSVSVPVDVFQSTIVPDPTARTLPQVSIFTPPLDIASSPAAENIFLPTVAATSTVVLSPKVDTLPLDSTVVSTSTIVSGPIVDTVPLLPTVITSSTIESGPTVETTPVAPTDVSNLAIVSGSTVDTTPGISIVVQYITCDGFTQTQNSVVWSRSEIKSQQTEPYTTQTCPYFTRTHCADRSRES
ncbi:hypothetical protein E4T38_08650 [Aureobasidium subglaciale]|nr:hypothetical protein E4T38_08650 [Aureobasidium subglaciale]KAI5215044.1 hypothetical protein E4T40_08663 [Aureobasidium subglaciale]KAI5218152.1 hypothetical protein E4T41_08517 [Aureobasidium subglaciale]KAI5255929.1 hypothetical protein E4T46_08551 [Aureobasidium subglaciale]